MTGSGHVPASHRRMAFRWRWMTIALCLLSPIACSSSVTPSDEVAPPPPGGPVAPATALSVLSTLPPQGVVVGNEFSLNVAQSGLRFSDPRNTGLTYTIALQPANTGLRVVGSTIVGVPQYAGVINATVRATDATGSAAESGFAILALSNELSTPVLPATAYAYSDQSAPIPFPVSNSPQVALTDNVPEGNQVTDAGAALGRVLFYDRRLSVNDRVSCASCHQQQFSFGDTARLSRGAMGELTNRHSMPLINTRYYRSRRFFRDDRAESLEALVLQPISDPAEMALPKELLVPKLEMAGFYGPLFTAAFGTSTISRERIALAMSQFVRALVTTHTKRDSILLGTASFTPLELRGINVFESAGCLDCHESYLHVSDQARNNGLDARSGDRGAGQGRFKSPSLRNVAIRTPYMHDGRFRTLDEVIDFYNDGVQDTPDLDPRMRGRDGLPRKLHLTSDDKLALKAFLSTLTDRDFLTDPRYANPFSR